MDFKDIEGLRIRIRPYLSEKRYKHTLGVEETAALLAGYIMPADEMRIRAAALLHDVSKEMNPEVQAALLRSVKSLTESDVLSEPAHHAFTAPVVIKRDFADFADDDILSATFNHTTGAPDMSIFDQIIFISDYVEPGRKYSACVELNKKLFDALNMARDVEECIAHLNVATVEALNNTVKSLIDRGAYINERTVATRNAFLGRIPMPIN